MTVKYVIFLYWCFLVSIKMCLLKGETLFSIVELKELTV